MRRAIDQIEQAPTDHDIKRGVLLDLPRVDDLHLARQPRHRHVVDRVREEHDQLGHDNRLTIGPPLQPTLSPRGRRPIFRWGEGDDAYPSNMSVAGMRWIALAVTAELSPGPNPTKPPHAQQTRCSLTTERLTSCPWTPCLSTTPRAPHSSPLTPNPSPARGEGNQRGERCPRRSTACSRRCRRNRRCIGWSRWSSRSRTPVSCRPRPCRSSRRFRWTIRSP